MSGGRSSRSNWLKLVSINRYYFQLSFGTLFNHLGSLQRPPDRRGGLHFEGVIAGHLGQVGPFDQPGSPVGVKPFPLHPFLRM